MQRWNDGWVRELLAVANRVRSSGLRPVAAFDFDQTCIEGDLGAQFHLELSRRQAYQLGPSSPLRALLRSTPEAVQLVARLDSGERFTPGVIAEMACLYTRVLRARGSFEAAAWAPQLHAGFRVSELETIAATVWRELLCAAPEECALRCDDGTEVRWRRGLRVRPRMVALIDELERAGVEVRVVSQTNIWALRPAMKALHLPVERAVGSRCEVVEGIIQAALVLPTTFREGKVACHAAAAGANSCLILAAGDSENDIALLKAAGSGLWVERGDGRHLALAATHGWQVVAPSWLMEEG